MSGKIASYDSLHVYQNAFQRAMQIFEITRRFPSEERYSLTDQIRRSSRSVCANLAEAWRKRRYEAAFIAKLSDSESEANETQVWLDFAVHCRYLEATTGQLLKGEYDHIIGQIVCMARNPKDWILKG
jgi:four helix bundle protein